MNGMSSASPRRWKCDERGGGGDAPEAEAEAARESLLVAAEAAADILQYLS